MTANHPNLGALTAPLQMSTVERVDGPLLFVTGVEGVGWDDYVEIMVDDGDLRHGIVVEIDHDLAVVEVFEGTDGIGRNGNTISCTYRPPEIPVA